MEALTEEKVKEQSAAWQRETGLDDLSRACFEDGMKWARDRKLLDPYPWSGKEAYVAVLVNAIRMSTDDMSRLVRDLVERGAALPHGG